MSKKQLPDVDIEKLQGYLVKYRINHQYDTEMELFDGNVPYNQILVRTAFNLLKRLDKLPQGVPWIQEELKRENENRT